MKKIIFKVYDKNGKALTDFEDEKRFWSDAIFDGFPKKINSGLGECVLRLPRKFEDYGEYEDVALNNMVKVIVQQDDGDEYVVYTGYISQYSPVVSRGKEYVEVSLLGYQTKLTQEIYKNGANTTITQSGIEIGQMVRNLFARYGAESQNPQIPLGTIADTNEIRHYVFACNTYRQALDTIMSFAPDNYYWTITGDGVFIFRQISSTPDHELVLGKHFSDLKAVKSMEKIQNSILFWNRQAGGDAIFKLYEDEASIRRYGRRVLLKTDYRVPGEGEMDDWVAELLAKNKDEHVSVAVEIPDNTYDIEDLEVGDTIKFTGFTLGQSETFKENMVITQIDYTLNKVRLIVEPVKAGLISRVDGIDLKVKEIDTETIPSSYTT